MKFIYLFVGLLCLSPCSWGNGGGYAPRGGSSGNVLPFVMEGVENIAMEEEDLSIELWTNYAQINVRYKLKNTTDSPVKVRFGFPVETNTSMAFGYLDAERSGGSRTDNRYWAKNPVLSYKASLNDKQLNHQFESQTQPLDADVKSGLCLHGWLVSDMTIPPREDAVLCIDTQMEYVWDDPMSALSDNYHQSQKKMIYRLSTAAVWNGPIKRGTITIKARGIDDEDVSFKAPVNRFKHKGNSWVWNFENLEPALKDDLVLEVTPEIEGMYSSSGYAKKRGDGVCADRVMSRGGKWYREISPDTWKMTASSSSDQNGNPVGSISHDKPWVSGEQVPGKEERLTIELKQPERLGGIILNPGLMGKEFENCNSIEKMKIVANNGAWSRPVRFERNQGEKRQERWISLEGCPEKISKLELVIQSVYAGKNQSKSVGISKLELYKKLSKKPVILPCR